MIQRVGEAIVLRVWPFHEADLLVSLFTREQGRVKGVARHAMRSRRRFGGALEPMTHVRASYAERPKQELVRLDAFEILSSPLARPVDYARTAALQFVAEGGEGALPEGGAGGGSASVCSGDAGAASGAAIGEREGVGKRMRIDGSVRLSGFFPVLGSRRWLIDRQVAV